MKNITRGKTAALVLCALSLCSTSVWRARGQNRPSPEQAQRQWDYRYDSASKSFPSDADKAKIAFYGVNGWELVAVVAGQYETALVFKRLKQAAK